MCKQKITGIVNHIPNTSYRSCYYDDYGSFVTIVGEGIPGVMPLTIPSTTEPIPVKIGDPIYPYQPYTIDPPVIGTVSTTEQPQVTIFTGESMKRNNMLKRKDKKEIMPKRETMIFGPDATKPDLNVYLLLDCSGSMYNKVKEVLRGVNEFLHQKRNDNIIFTIIMFDDKIEVLRDTVHASICEPISEHEYFARGMTSLNDVLGVTIQMAKDDQEIMEEEFGFKPSVLIMPFTDGGENSSEYYTHKEISDMREECILTDLFTFTFVGSDITASSDVAQYGIDEGCTVRFSETSITQTMDCLSQSTAYLMNQIQQGKSSVRDFATNSSLSSAYKSANASIGGEAFNIYP